MEKLLLFISAASGLCAVSSTVERRYHFVYERKTWTEALSYCRDKYTDLASIDNMDEVKVLNDMADKMKYSYEVWIGLYNDVNSWRWSMSDGDLYKHDETSFRKWASREPNNDRALEQCAVMNADGKWNDEFCNHSLKAICFDDTGTNVSYVFINTNMTWPEAQTYCRTHHTDLASVRNITENQKVAAKVPPGDEAWIGLFRDSWKWTDGRNFSFRYWNDKLKEPNNKSKTETCAAAYVGGTGQWEDWPCYWKSAFICYGAVSKQVVKVKLVKNSSVNLSDPGVMEDLLQQLKQRLEDQGVKGDIKLSWRKQPDGKVFYKEEEETKKRTLNRRTKDDL